MVRNTSFYFEVTMARAGILYSHVAQAATSLVADGRNPTVDNVRAALGGTGSKSTIAPFLKRWKMEHQETIAEAHSGLPATLLQAVKGLHQHMQAEVGQQLDQARQEHDAALHAAVAREQQLRADHQALSAANAALSADLEHAREALAQLQASHHAQAVTLATAQADNAGLQQRLADRAAEVAALNHQWSRSREQFEHYQEATAGQRAQERQAAEQRIARLEQDLAGARQAMLAQQATTAQQEMQIAQLRTEAGRLHEAGHAVQDELASVRAERDQLAYRLRETATTSQALVDKLEAAQQALTESRMALAAQERQTALVAERVGQAEAKAEQLDKDRLALFQERAVLLAQRGKGQTTTENAG
jgi:chromosome segregation ATPase